MTTPEQPTATDPTEQSAPARAAGRTGKAATRTAPADAVPAATDAPAAAATDSATDGAADSAADSALDSAPTTVDDDAEGATDGAAEPEKRRRGRPKGSAARTTRTIELILTVSGTADGEWQAELKQGSTWLSRGLPVTAAAVAQAARALHPELGDPIESAIGAAREQRAARVAALEAELEQARKALAEIEG
jgi:hypothetical protein